jgi:hypothetical protein
MIGTIIQKTGKDSIVELDRISARHEDDGLHHGAFARECPFEEGRQRHQTQLGGCDEVGLFELCGS